jgi:NADH:ubiquinone reductase (non-electrogenic)
MPLPRIVILGTGFGAFNLVAGLRRGYDITVVSPRNHFLFTPLLPSTTVGTLEFRSIIEPIRHANTAIRFLHAGAERLDSAAKRVFCRGVFRGDQFSLVFDHLVIAVGAVSNTFNVPGVKEHAHFLRELNDARELRQQIIKCFERANLPDISSEIRLQMLHFVIVGGGPTGVEFAAELNDFLLEDLHHAYPERVAEARITLLEAQPGILGGFDERLRAYAVKLFRRHRITVVTGTPVVRVDADAVHLRDGSSLPYGLLLWSTGNAPTPFVAGLPFVLDRRGLVVTDEYFAVKGANDIYAIGDCSSIEGLNLPATAQVAQQEGKYLARSFQRRARGLPVEPFRYRHLGMLAYIGGDRALVDLEPVKGRGWAAWLFWRSAYVSRIVSLKNKVLVLFDWFKAMVFGRDISQF